MSRKIFITATDTGVGKTKIATDLLRSAAAQGLVTVGMKPVASGCDLINGKLYNSDALQLQSAATQKLHYDVINPFAFAPPIAPHIAAQASGIELSVASLVEKTTQALSTAADLHIIEGFGGWHAPLNSHETMGDYAVSLQCEVLLVVGIRLGCLNHAILTERAIHASGLKCTGWIANLLCNNMTHANENIATLQHWLLSPLLTTIDYQGNFDNIDLTMRSA